MDSTIVYRRLDAIADTKPLIEWCRKQPVGPEYWNGLPTSRLHRWWGKSVTFAASPSAATFGIFSPVATVQSGRAFDSTLEELRDRYYPEADSALLYFYRPGSAISEHSDKSVFSRRVVMVNLMDFPPDLLGEKPLTRFRFEGRNKFLLDGDVIQFDSRIRHSIPKVKHHRYSLQLRRVIS